MNRAAFLLVIVSIITAITRKTKHAKKTPISWKTFASTVQNNVSKPTNPAPNRTPVRGPGERPVWTNPNPNPNAKPKTTSEKARYGAIHQTTLNTDLFENRKGDWLAEQIREEKRLLRKTSDMFALKQEHLENCDADDLKQSHARAHRSNRIDS